MRMESFEQEDLGIKKNYEIKLACTMNRFLEMQNVIERLSPDICIRVGGAGNKGIFILEGQADCMIHVVEGLKCWDLVAVDALIKSRFGITSNKSRKPLLYED